MSILGECFFKMSNAVFCYDFTPIQPKFRKILGYTKRRTPAKETKQKLPRFQRKNGGWGVVISYWQKDPRRVKSIKK